MVRTFRSASAAALAVAFFGALGPAHSANTEPVCERVRPVVFATPRAETAAFHTAVARRIVQDGFGCETVTVDGSTETLVAAVAEGDADILMEVWTDDAPRTLATAEAAGRVVRLGTIVPDGEAGWYMPRFVVEGADPPAQGLTSLADLAPHRAVFRDPEEPDKGRFFNCVIGWPCEARNSRKLEAYGLAEAFANVRPGSHEALVAQVEEAIARGEPVLFAYWSPSALAARHDLVRLTEPAHATAGGSSGVDGRKTAAPVEIVAVANVDLPADAPALAAFVGRYRLSAAAVDAAIAGMAIDKESADEAAARFLAEHPQLWSA